LELENLKNPQGEIIYWQQDPYTKRSFTLNNKRYTFRPDIFVIYKYSQNRIKIMFVECDNATESINRLKGKIRMYHNYFLSGVWRQEYWSRSIPNTFPLVVFLTTVKNDSSKLNRYSESIDSPIRFIFLTYDQLIDFQYKIYESSFGKKRSVLQSIESKILDLIG